MGKNHIYGIEKFKTIPPFSKKENHPAYLNENYQNGSKIIINENDLSKLATEFVEIKCSNPACKLTVRSHGNNAATMYNKLKDSGCPVCGQKSFELSTI